MKGDFSDWVYGTRIYASKRQTKAGERAEFYGCLQYRKIIQLNTEQNKKYPIENIIQECLCEDEKKNYQSARDIKRS